MKVMLVFEDWQKSGTGKSVYDDLDNGLTLGPFHHGTSFEAEIDMPEDCESELSEAMKNGFTPVFAVVVD